jgi:hypothetical protein
MLEQIKILTSRRAYEFHADDLRLSTLSLKPVQDQIQQLFQFQATIMGQPMPTFGEVPATYPPGMVFDMGTLVSPNEQLIPIRFLHFEQRRIVIDVAGPSSAITTIFERLQQFLSGLQAADGSPVIGTSQRTLDYSEITAQFPFSLESLLALPLRKFFSKAVNASAENNRLVLLPTFAAQSYSDNQEIAAAATPGDPYAFTFVSRPGTKPEEHIYLSAAPLDSETHLSSLNELESSLDSE